MLLSGPQPPTPPLLLPESSGEDGGAHDHDSSSRASAPKKRAETWVQDETLSLIALRREMDNHFNTSKSNKHLWEAISAKMREQGFDRSPTMCTDKWRNLLKEFKKARSHARSSAGAGGNGSAKMAYYKEIDDLLKRRGKAAASPAGSGGGGGAAKSPTPTSKIESYLQFADKGFEDANIPFGPVEGEGSPNNGIEEKEVGCWKSGEREREEQLVGEEESWKRFCNCLVRVLLPSDPQPMWQCARPTMMQANTVLAQFMYFDNPTSVINIWLLQLWFVKTRNVETSVDSPITRWLAATVLVYFYLIGGDNQGTYGGRVILVKWGDYTKRIGIDGTAEAIKEAIKSAFGLRTRRAFWLEDEDEVVRSLDRDMPVGVYTLHLDNGITIKLCTFEDADRMTVRTEDKTFYTEDDFRDFLSRRGWTLLREYSGYRVADTLDDLRPGVIYQGMRSLVD
ncbi:unnamed protein product [Triticum turgidum subsp. durum]|uniref:Myb-like domain-containing protein n=1 Tax=Triticum turgidum subsp. durum TaxID=4567 RepID=A0A9R1NYU1_TRITD|nr:unnamed protein product [Triticum turgidum subsp. durum]